MNRLYPSTKFSRTNSMKKQLEHIQEEFIEAMTAETLEKRDEELADLEHSIQTYFDMRAAKGVDIDLVRQKVIEKNRKRHYYQGQTAKGKEGTAIQDGSPGRAQATKAD